MGSVVSVNDITTNITKEFEQHVDQSAWAESSANCEIHVKFENARIEYCPVNISNRCNAKSIASIDNLAEYVSKAVSDELLKDKTESLPLAAKLIGVNVTETNVKETIKNYITSQCKSNASMTSKENVNFFAFTCIGSPKYPSPINIVNFGNAESSCVNKLILKAMSDVVTTNTATSQFGSDWGELMIKGALAILAIAVLIFVYKIATRITTSDKLTFEQQKELELYKKPSLIGDYIAYKQIH